MLLHGLVEREGMMTKQYSTHSVQDMDSPQLGVARLEDGNYEIHVGFMMLLLILF